MDRRPPGPGSATVMALSRIGWRADSFRTWVAHEGWRLDLATHCPRTVTKIAARAVTRWQWTHLIKQYDEFRSLGVAGDAGPVTRAIRGKTGLSARQRGSLRAAAYRSLWPSQRRAEEGYQVASSCEACGKESGTLRHAIWRCPAQAALRY